MSTQGTLVQVEHDRDADLMPQFHVPKRLCSLFVFMEAERHKGQCSFRSKHWGTCGEVGERKEIASWSLESTLNSRSSLPLRSRMLGSMRTPGLSTVLSLPAMRFRQNEKTVAGAVLRRGSAMT